MDEQAFDTLVTALYEAVDGAQGWAPVLDALGEALDAPDTQFMALPPALPPEEPCADPRLARLQAMAPGAWVFGQDPDPEGDLHWAGLKVLHDPAHALVLLVSRGSGRRPFDPAQRLLLQRLRDHLVRALGLHLRLRGLAGLSGLAAGVIGRLQKPALVIDARRRPGLVNPQAQDLLSHDDGPLLLRRGRLHARRSDLDEQLGGALALMTRPEGRSSTPRFLPLPGPDRLRWHGLSLSTLDGGCITAEGMGRDGPGVPLLLTLHPCSLAAAPDESLLQSAFLLTRAEAVVARHLYEGLEPARIAASVGVSVTTVRSHMARAFCKMQADRQSTVVRMIADLVAA